tara:strand:- start:940 stop:1536 length:597 start_codon:yes stop_codon:yes gene_type:complete
LKNDLTIYSNFNNYSFFKQIFNKYKLIFKQIDDLFKGDDSNKSGIIFYNSPSDDLNIFKYLSGNFLIFTNYKKQNNKFKDNITIINKLSSPNQIREYTQKFFSNKKILHKDIFIFNEKVVNSLNNKSCLLTDIELQILIYLMNNKTCSKEYIKKYILKVNDSVETKSIESHLTRIRKKFIKIETSTVIKSKNNDIIIV